MKGKKAASPIRISELKLKINVKAIDIERGERSNECDCPIVRATLRQLHLKRFSVSVLPHWVHERERPGKYVLGVNRYQDECLPPIANRFVTDFDKGKTVKPFSFSITLRPKK